MWDSSDGADWQLAELLLVGKYDKAVLRAIVNAKQLRRRSVVWYVNARFLLLTLSTPPSERQGDMQYAVVVVG